MTRPAKEKTITTCPTCGTEVTVQGKMTHSYVPGVSRESYSELKKRYDKLLAELCREYNVKKGAREK